VLQKAAARS